MGALAEHLLKRKRRIKFAIFALKPKLFKSSSYDLFLFALIS